MRKPKREKFKVYKDVFDASTSKVIFDLMAKHIIEGLEAPIKIGKESNVFSALKKKKKRIERVAVKIYRVMTCDFRRMNKYLTIDPRFIVRKSRKATVSAWAKREFTNLNKAYKAGVVCPKPIAVKENVLVMEFIGSKYGKMPTPAPLLKDVLPNNMKQFFLLLAEQTAILFQKAKLVHGDLSEFNIMNYKEKPIIIDLSHALPVSFATLHYREFLQRDINNLARFFTKHGLNINKQALYNYIVGKITKQEFSSKVFNDK